MKDIDNLLFGARPLRAPARKTHCARAAVCAALAAWACASAAAEPSVTSVTARQRYPWNVVDITVEWSADAGAVCELTFDAVDAGSGKVVPVRTVWDCAAPAATNMAFEVTGSGSKVFTWDAAADLSDGFKADRVSLSASIIRPYRFTVIDLSAGAAASSYPVTNLYDEPAGGFNTDEYKTSKLVLRRIPRGTFTMGDTVHFNDGYPGIVISKPYAIGLFEVTQRQWELVMGANPSYFTFASCYATRPVDRVSYDMARGSVDGASWPETALVDGDSFLGKLRARTKLDLDLPTEAQWEFACRAGTTTDFNNGANYASADASSDPALTLLGRYWANGGYSFSSGCDDSQASAKVGSYQPNAWGLYDMHGNAAEWCLDWFGPIVPRSVDPRGYGQVSPQRTCRGGSWQDYPAQCASGTRKGIAPKTALVTLGLRLAAPVNR